MRYNFTKLTLLLTMQIQQVVDSVPSLQRLRVHSCPLTVAELAPTAELHPRLRILRMAPPRLN